jgi:hypothetical protein
MKWRNFFGARVVLSELADPKGVVSTKRIKVAIAAPWFFFLVYGARQRFLKSIET